MILFTLVIAVVMAATPTPVSRTEVRFGVEKNIAVESKPGSVSVDFTEGQVRFRCSESGRTNRWKHYEKFLNDVADQAPTHPEADFGMALDGVVGMMGASKEGHCNMTASTRNGVLILIVSHNDACLGSAGCQTSYAAYVTDPSNIKELAEAIGKARISAEEKPM